MYQALTDFLRTFSAAAPLPWALLVMVVIAVAGLVLYAFWELLLRGLGRVFSGGGNGNRSGGGSHGGH